VTHLKLQKITRKVILLSAHWHFGDVLVGNITLFVIFAVLYVSLTVNLCIKCSYFLHFHNIDNLAIVYFAHGCNCIRVTIFSAHFAPVTFLATASDTKLWLPRPEVFIWTAALLYLLSVDVGRCCTLLLWTQRPRKHVVCLWNWDSICNYNYNCNYNKTITTSGLAAILDFRYRMMSVGYK